MVEHEKIIKEHKINGEMERLSKIERLTARAEAGDAKAQYKLGRRYSVGRDGVERNASEAVKWFRKSAEQGYAPAQFHLAECYTSGVGVAHNSFEALKWLRKAADQGYYEARVILDHVI